MKSYGYPSFGKIEYMYDNYVHVPHLSKAADEDRKILTTGGWLTDAHICSFPKRRCCRTRSLLHPGQNSKILNLLKSTKMDQTTGWFLASSGKIAAGEQAAGEQASSNTQGAPTSAVLAKSCEGGDSKCYTPRQQRSYWQQNYMYILSCSEEWQFGTLPLLVQLDLTHTACKLPHNPVHVSVSEWEWSHKQC